MASAEYAGNPDVPIVDLSAYVNGIAEERSLLQEGFEWSERMFDLSLEDKMKAPHPPGYNPHRGYSYPGLEKVHAKRKQLEAGKSEPEAEAEAEAESAGPSVLELKESYEIGSEQNSAQTNVWLPEETLPGYRAFMTNFYWQLNETSRIIAQAMGDGLGLSESETQSLLAMLSGHNNQLRLLHYPPVSAKQVEAEMVTRMPAHTDWSFFTMLFQDPCGGLELEDPSKCGTFVPAAPLSGALVVNIGEMFQRASNGRYKAANHRVALSPLETLENGERFTKQRYSIPYFVSPDDEAVVECFASLVDEKHPAQYEPIQFKDYAAWVAGDQYERDTA